MTKEEYYELFKGKKCKRLGANHPKADRLDLHKIKMQMKGFMRDMRDALPVPHILANISKHHKHYGETVAQHNQRKNNS